MGDARKADMELFARCASGFEQLLAAELKGLHASRVRPLRGGVAFFGTLADAYGACLWSRIATRIQLVLARIPAKDADELYRGVAGFAWEDHILPKASIAVDAHGQNDQLRNSKFTGLKVKDAICDRLRDVRGARPNVDTTDPDFCVNVALHQRKATLYLNLSGPSLHRRGYRQDGMQTEAPLKETLAAGMLLASEWDDVARNGGALVDPMCGSGTLAIEAALIAAHVAPGLLRDRWGFQGWSQHDARLWDRLVQEAVSSRIVPLTSPLVLAGDIDRSAVEIARANASRAGVQDLLRFYVEDAAKLGRQLSRCRWDQGTPGLLATNPPYGQRLLSQAELPRTYAALATGAKALPSGWRMALITPDAGVDTALGRTPHTTIPCFNGPIATWIRLYGMDDEPLVHQVTSLGGRSVVVPIAERNSAQFAARLRKVAKERAKWARKAGVQSYRIYDADLPEYACSIELFASPERLGGERFVRIAERRRPSSVDAQRAARRLSDVAALSAATLDVDRSNVVVVPWGDESRDHRWATICEGPYVFEVDLARPESRLPLAQRLVRKHAAELGRSARVACMFATSASYLVYAAGGGARSAVLVDAAPSQLDVARKVMRDNGFGGSQFRHERMDVRSWLAREAKAHHTYDLVICVAPQWLPARDAGGHDWDLRRDGAALLQAATRVLSHDGKVLFVCEGTATQPSKDALVASGLVVEDLGGRMTPHDFERSRDVATCLLVRKRNTSGA